ncbi:hypothetical protein BT96DRAFT_1001754 [Gymnopus androsaceus JB14]|uniref:Uncharacterized protein n=1 Tax=Gymnopus androsaceus JB14 TaxID=1447944 RepID=A0A6A4GYX6_9AGAR|nr:hypothetical protein BT96DRAFT_1001754 [Gymnopus androsaceus JB14]
MPDQMEVKAGDNILQDQLKEGNQNTLLDFGGKHANPLTNICCDFNQEQLTWHSSSDRNSSLDDYDTPTWANIQSWSLDVHGTHGASRPTFTAIQVADCLKVLEDNIKKADEQDEKLVATICHHQQKYRLIIRELALLKNAQEDLEDLMLIAWDRLP